MDIAIKALLVGLLLTPGLAQAQPLGLAEVQQKVLQTSPSLREQTAKGKEARFKVDEAYTAAYPTLNFSAGYTHLTPTSQILLGPRAIDVIVENNYSLGLSLRQAIYTFGRLEWSAANAELQEKSSAAERSYQEARVLEEATVSFYEAQQALFQSEIALTSQKARQAHLKQAESLLKAGSAPRFDVARDQAALAGADQAVLEASNRTQLARVKLAVLMGEDLGDRPLAGEEGELPKPPTKLELEQVMTRRQDLRALEFAHQAAEARIELARASDNPSLNLQSDYVQRNAVGFNPGQQWSVGVQLAVPLFDGGVSQAKAGQAEEVAHQLQAIYDQAKRQVHLEVESLYLELINRFQRIETANRAVIAAREAARISRLRYQNGYSTNVELLDSESALSQAETDLVSARFQYRIGWARFRRAGGVN